MVPSIYHIWYYTTLIGQHRKEMSIFRDWEPSIVCSLKGLKDIEAYPSRRIQKYT